MTVSPRADNRPLYEGFSDASTRAIQLVVTPLVLALLGFLLDGRTHTRPLLAIVFGVLGLASESYRMYLAYQAEMRKREEGKPWAK
ncbi:MAG TPA: AtpZ/AtpI family protein [Acidimicrobiales bacterium]|nr:AtpZ/AtpI family protein [Acidimicrobiales bacterium]